MRRVSLTDECQQPQQVDSKLEASAAGIQALMADIAAAAAAKSAELPAPANGEAAAAAADGASTAGTQPARGQTEEPEAPGDAPEGDADIAALRSTTAGREQTIEDRGLSEEDEDELEAPSIASGDESEREDQVSIAQLLNAVASSGKATANAPLHAAGRGAKREWGQRGTIGSG